MKKEREKRRKAGGKYLRAKEDPVPTGLNYFRPVANAPQTKRDKHEFLPRQHNYFFTLTLLVCLPSFMMAPLTRSAVSVGVPNHRSQVDISSCGAVFRQLANGFLHLGSAQGT